MEQLALYLLKSSLCLAAFTALYLVFFKKETFYRFNRYFLLAGLASAIVLPFYTYTYQVSVAALVESPTFPGLADPINQTERDWMDFIPLMYLLICAMFLLSKGRALLKLKRSIHALGYMERKGYKLVKTNLFKTSFSVFNYIIIHHSPDHTQLEQDLVLAHEEAHVKQKHWIDLLLIQVFCSFQWFNPLAWFYQGLIKENHEFLADAAVLAQGNSAALYRATLINHALGLPVFALASSFSRADKMGRIKMMTRPKSPAFRKLAALAILPGLLFLIWLFAKPEYVLAQQTSIKSSAAPKSSVVPVSRPDIVADQKLKPEAKPKVQKVTRLRREAPVQVATPVEIVVHGIPAASGSIDSARIQGAPSHSLDKISPAPLFFLDGQPVAAVDVIPADAIASISVIKGQAAVERYGAHAKNGVVLIVSKKASTLHPQP